MRTSKVIASHLWPAALMRSWEKADLLPKEGLPGNRGTELSLGVTSHPWSQGGGEAPLGCREEGTPRQLALGPGGLAEPRAPHPRC